MTATIDPDGCMSLLVAFWRLVRYDLATGNHATRDWLGSDEFAWWAGHTLPMPPDAARAALDAHWQAAMRDPDTARCYGRWSRTGGMHASRRHRPRRMA